MTHRMRSLLGAVALALLAGGTDAAAEASSLTGLWLTQDHDGIIRITDCGGNLCAEIAGLILDHAGDPTPTDYRGVSQCHLPLVTDARQIQPNLWKGHITDPRNGGVYGVELSLDARGDLALRGFLGIPLLGHTQTWTRYGGTVPEDCLMDAGGAVDRTSGYPAVPSGPIWDARS